MLRRQLPAAIAAVIALTILTGIAYPLAITGVAQVLFPSAADGSLIERGGEVLGSELIGREFEGPGDFHPRPSAAGEGYDGADSSGSNLAPSNPELLEQVAERVADYRAENGLGPNVRVPVDAVTASASGLDPDISVRNARLQAPRVAEARGLELDTVEELIDRNTTGRALGILGEPTVNVQLLNLALHAAPRAYPQR